MGCVVRPSCGSSRIAGVRIEPRPGRLNVYGQLLETLIDERERKGIAEEKIGREDAEIRRAWSARYPDVKCPFESAVKRAIREYRGGS